MKRDSRHAIRGRLPIGRLIVSLAAVVAFLGIASAPAFAAPQHWYSAYEGPAEEHNSELTAGVEETVSGHGQSTIKLGWNIGGVRFEVTCSGLSTGGSITNPAGGGAGQLAGALFTLNECRVTAPVGGGCTVPSTLIFETLKAEGVVQEGTSAIRFVPQSGAEEPFIVLPVSECTSPALNGNKPLKGQITGVESGGGSVYSFTSTSGSELTFGGQRAFINGELGLETEAGATVALAISGEVPRWHLITYSHEFTNSELAEGTPTTFTPAPGSTLSLSQVVAGIHTTVNCEGGLSGMVENPTGGEAGTAGGTLGLSNCTFQPEKVHCSVSAVEPAELDGTVTESGGEPGVSWVPAAGERIVTFSVSGCSAGALDGNKPLKGILAMTQTAEPGGFAFSGGELTFGGQNSSAGGQTTLQNSASEGLFLAP